MEKKIAEPLVGEEEPGGSRDLEALVSVGTHPFALLWAGAF